MKIKKFKSCSADLLPFINNITTETCNYVVLLNEIKQNKIKKKNMCMHH